MAEQKKRPDARPMRLAYAAGTVAALSAAAAGLVRFGTGAADTAPVAGLSSTDPGAVASPATAQVRHVINYIHLKPGQTAPPGAKVITEKAPAPRIVVTRVPVPVHNPPPRVIVTHQSGHP